MLRTLVLRMAVILAVVTAGIPASAVSQASATEPAPCHQTADTPQASENSHASCDNCTMACCVAQIPVTPSFETAGFILPVPIVQGHTPDDFFIQPPTAPPRV